jgi:hypothetical protein
MVVHSQALCVDPATGGAGLDGSLLRISAKLLSTAACRPSISLVTLPSRSLAACSWAPNLDCMVLMPCSRAWCADVGIVDWGAAAAHAGVGACEMASVEAAAPGAEVALAPCEESCRRTDRCRAFGLWLLSFASCLQGPCLRPCVSSCSGISSWTSTLPLCVQTSLVTAVGAETADATAQYCAGPSCHAHLGPP